MGNPTGFIEIKRLSEASEPVDDRIHHSREFVARLDDAAAGRQGARCMDCGIPFCQSGCPVSNIIPDWNDLVYRNQWQSALATLHSTNNFPEFTGRVCPAPCEAACTLNINSDPVGIKSIEHAIIDKGWEMGWVVPEPAARKNDHKVAIIGSGPSGLACAQQLARAGYAVTVFEKSDRIGGLLRYGIPDFKLAKELVDRRVAQMESEGVVFRTSVVVGAGNETLADGSAGREQIAAQPLLADFDAVVLAIGAEQPRDLEVTGRELGGVHFAMEFLRQQNKAVAGDRISDQIVATDKHVIVIGGGDTGSDCVGTSIRQGAASVTQIELMPKPPESENKPQSWPYWPNKLRTSSSQEEGCERDWAVATTALVGNDAGQVEKLKAVRLKWVRDEASGQMKMEHVKGSEFELPADLVLLAMGFVSPVPTMLAAFGVAQDQRGNAQAAVDGALAYRTDVSKVFAAGDARRGQSLVVWAIREGRQCARAVDQFLMGRSDLAR